MKLNQPARAIPLSDTTRVLNRADADALYQLGLVYEAGGQSQLAVRCYHQAVRLVPDLVHAYQAMVTSYSALGLSHAVAYARGMEAFCLQDYDLAVTYLEQATTALPTFSPAFFGIGLAYERMGRLDAALAATQRACELYPRDPGAQQATGRIQAALNAQDQKLRRV